MQDAEPRGVAGGEVQQRSAGQSRAVLVRPFTARICPPCMRDSSQLLRYISHEPACKRAHIQALFLTKERTRHFQNPIALTYFRPLPYYPTLPLSDFYLTLAVAGGATACTVPFLIRSDRGNVGDELCGRYLCCRCLKEVRWMP